MFRQGLAQRLAMGGARFKALSPASKIALVFLVLVALVAVFAPVVATHDPLAAIARMRPPSGDFLFGTDRLGRDIFSRIVYGAQTSLFIGLGAVGCAILFGGILGATAATADRWGNEIIMRLMDILMAFPGIALAAVLLATFGNTVSVIIFTIAVVYTPQLARVVRANVVSQWDDDYVRAERVIGGSRTYILLKHVVRNTAAPVLVFATVMVADAIVFEASLSFLGAGVQPPHPSWGNVLSEGRNIVLNGAWWATTFAGVMILLTVLALNILAEGLTDALVNPRLKASKKSEHKSDERLSTDVQEALGEGLALKRYLLRLHDKEVTRTDRMQLNSNAKPILQVKNLSIRFPNRYGDIPLVDNISFTVNEGETMGLVGESGCGKSTTARVMVGLQPITSGEVLFKGRKLTHSKADRRDLGRSISVVFQDPATALNPRMIVHDTLIDPLNVHGIGSPKEREARVRELLALVGLPLSALDVLPRQISGGQRQRVAIARALALDPDIIVADEPTSALDVSVRAQVLNLLQDLKASLGLGLVFISHDINTVRYVSDRIAVMYYGKIIEENTTQEIFAHPKDAYTRKLLSAVPSLLNDAGPKASPAA